MKNLKTFKTMAKFLSASIFICIIISISILILQINNMENETVFTNSIKINTNKEVYSYLYKNLPFLSVLYNLYNFINIVKIYFDEFVINAFGFFIGKILLLCLNSSVLGLIFSLIIFKRFHHHNLRKLGVYWNSNKINRSIIFP